MKDVSTVDYNINYICQKRICHYDVNGYDITFHTKSNREVLMYLQNMENMLMNNLRFMSVEELNTDKFNAIEYFSLAYPELVKNYFMQMKEQLSTDIKRLGIRRVPSKFMTLLYIGNIPVAEIPISSNYSDLSKIYYVAIGKKSATKKILIDLMPYKNNVTPSGIAIDNNPPTPYLMEISNCSQSKENEKITYAINKAYYNGYWQHNVNGYDIAFRTKSSKEVLVHLQNMEVMLTNTLRFSSIHELSSDKFNAIEYFSLAYPEMVKNYFKQIIELLFKDIKTLRINKTPSIFMALSFVGNIPVSDCLKIDTSSVIYKVFRKATRLNKSATNKILEDLFCSLSKYTDIQRCFTTTCGELKYIGVKPGSNQYLWELGGFTQPIFMEKQKTINESAEEIIRKLTYIHGRITSNIVSELIDFTYLEDIKILTLYAKAHIEQVRKYIEILIDNNIKNGIQLRKSGAIDGFSNIDILITLSKNKNRKQIEAHSANKFLGTLRTIINDLIREYLIKQTDLFIERNSFNLSDDKWNYYYKRNGRLRKKVFDFSLLENSIAKREFKIYVKTLIGKDAQTKNTLRENKSLGYRLGDYYLLRASLDYFIREQGISCFADITDAMVADYLNDLEYNSLKDRVHKSVYTIGSCIDEIKEYAKWLCKNADKLDIKKPKTNVFIAVKFNGRRIAEQNEKETLIIPEFVIKQIQENLHFLKPEAYKRLLLCLLNSPRRFNEFQQLSSGDIKPKMHNNNQAIDKSGNPIYQMKVIEHKKQSNKDIDNYGLNYNRRKKVFNVNYIIVREVENQIKDNKILENEINLGRDESDKIHITKVFILKDDTMKDGYSLIESGNFINTVNRFFKSCNIVDSNEEPWLFTTRQTRTTGTSILVANGHDLGEIQDQLGHENSATTYKSYIKLSHLQMARENTEYLKSEFDSLFSKDSGKFDDYEIIALFNKYCIDYNKIYYNRKLLGICGLAAGQKCPYTDGKNEMVDEIPCADCPTLYVGEPCKPGWEQICNQCKEDVDVLEAFFVDNAIPEEDAFKVKEYKSAYIKYIKAKRVIDAITEI